MPGLAFVAAAVDGGKPSAFAWMRQDGTLVSYAVLPREGWPGFDPQADVVAGKVYDLADCLWAVAAVADEGYRLISDNPLAISYAYKFEGWTHPPSINDWVHVYGCLPPGGPTVEERVQLMHAAAANRR